MTKMLTNEIIPELKSKILTNTDASVNSNNINWTTFGQGIAIGIPYARIQNDIPRINGAGPIFCDANQSSLTINNVVHTNDNTSIRGWWHGGGGEDIYGQIIHAEIGIITYADDYTLRGKIVYRYRHGNFGTPNHGQDWVTLN